MFPFYFPIFVQKPKTIKSMKHLLAITTMLLLAFTGNIKAGTNNSFINLQIKVSYDDTSNHFDKKPQSPIRKPVISQENNILQLSQGCEYYLFELIGDNDENIIYSEFITPNTDIITLPESLSGEYEIRLTRNNICFFGYINL